MIQNQTSFTEQLEYIFSIGNFTKDGVTLVDRQYNIIQLPKSILPLGTEPGSIIKMILKRDLEAEKKQEEQLNRIMNKLESGQHINQTIIGIDQDLQSSAGQAVNEQQLIHPMNRKLISKRKTSKPQQITSQQKLTASLMKKKPKPQQIKTSVFNQQKKQQKNQQPTKNQTPIQRQKSVSPKTSSSIQNQSSNLPKPHNIH